MSGRHRLRELRRANPHVWARVVIDGRLDIVLPHSIDPTDTPWVVLGVLKED